MEFIYKEETKEKCWYKENCPYYSKENGCELSLCQRHFKMEFLTHSALLFGNDKYPVDLFADEDGTDRETFKKLSEIKKDIMLFVEKGRNLVIWSRTTGNGKTTFAKKMILAYLDKIWHTTEFECRALFVDLPKYLNQLKRTFNGSRDEYVDSVNENIMKADLVVWDEIGLKKPSDTEIEYLINFLNTRISDGKANIFTSNMLGDDLKDNIKDRLYSRMVSNSKIIELQGRDKRLLSTNW